MARQPNIVFIFPDQQRWDTVGCYGGTFAELELTPNLDRMASEGVRFEHAFTCQPVCGPARACLQTGRYATETGCFTNDIALPPHEKTVAHWMSEAGYEVGYIGKWHLASTGPEFNFRTEPVPTERRGGWKDFWLAADVLEFTSHPFEGHLFDAEGNKVEFQGYRVDRMTDFVTDYLRSRSGERPFFLFVSYLEPHQQNDWNRFVGPEGSRERYRDFPVPGDLDGLDGDWPEQLPDYLGCCAGLDHNVGRILAELDNLGIADDTVVFYTADHGCHFRTRNGEYKRSCHDASIRIPMIARGPGFSGGRTVGQLVSLIDLPPTILSVAGVPVPDYMRGRPLQNVLAGANDWPEEVFVQISEAQIGRAIRTSRWKYSVRAPSTDPAAGGKFPASSVYREEFLYDLDADPHERNNLVADPDYADVREMLRERLRARMLQANEQARHIEPAE